MGWYFFKRFLLSNHAGSLTRVISRLCILGVGIAICAMVVVLSVMGGFGDHIEKRLLAFEPHLIIKSPKANDADKILSLKEALSETSQIPNSRSYLSDQQEVIVRNVDGLYGGALAQGLEPDSLNKILKTVRHQDSDFGLKSNDDLTQTELKFNEVIIGADLAHNIGAYPGDRIVITPPETLLLPAGEIPPYLTLTVQNVIRTNIPELDSQLLYYNKSVNPKLFKDAASFDHAIEIYVDDLSQVEKIKKNFESKGFLVQTWKDRNSTLYYSLKMERILIGFFLGLALFIGSFSILTVLLLLSTQKKHDIGILKTIGMTQFKIQSLFTQIGLILSGIGILGGLFIGIAICFMLDKFPIIKLPDVYYDRTIPVRYEPRTYFIVTLIALAITFFSSWFPAYWSSKVLPTEALRKR